MLGDLIGSASFGAFDFSCDLDVGARGVRLDEHLQGVHPLD
jgi:hypothetical protein